MRGSAARVVALAALLALAATLIPAQSDSASFGGLGNARAEEPSPERCTTVDPSGNVTVDPENCID